MIRYMSTTAPIQDSKRVQSTQCVTSRATYGLTCLRKRV